MIQTNTFLELDGEIPETFVVSVTPETELCSASARVTQKQLMRDWSR